MTQKTKYTKSLETKQTYNIIFQNHLYNHKSVVKQQANILPWTVMRDIVNMVKNRQAKCLRRTKVVYEYNFLISIQYKNLPDVLSK